MDPATEPSGRRLALIVATSVYEDTALSRLRAPAQDASMLAEVLADRRIGGFEVTQVIDRPKRDIEIAVEDFLSDRQPDDMLLLYLSCHGLLDARSTLYFAAGDTMKTRLGATALDAPKLKRQLEESRARRQLIVLDCCFSGAFLRNTKGDMDRHARPVELNRLQSEGRGQAILTASKATEYSLEGEPIDESTMAASVFTAILAEGLRTGDADWDNDGMISAHDAYNYTYQRMKAAKAQQTPLYGTPQTEGAIYFGHSVAGIRSVSPAMAVAAKAPVTQSVLGQVNSEIFTGAVAELAYMRRSKTLDDPQSLRDAALSGSVEEAVAIIAAGRAVGHEDKVDELLAMAARFRPAEDVVTLIASVRVAGHPNDAEQLLAAAGSGRPIADLISLAVVIGQSGEADDVTALWAAAASQRRASEVVDLVHELREEGRFKDAEYLLAEAAARSTETAMAESILAARKIGNYGDAIALVRAFQLRPIADVARLVGALRQRGDDEMASFALGLIERLEPGQILKLVTALRSVPDSDEDVDHVLRWSATHSAPAQFAKLMTVLAGAGRREDLTVVSQAAGRSRSPADLAAIVQALGPEIADSLLAAAASRPPRVVSDLLQLLEPPPAEGNRPPIIESDTQRRLARAVMRRPVPEAMAVFNVAPAPVQTRLMVACARTPSRHTLELMEAFGSLDRKQEFLRRVVEGPSKTVASFTHLLLESPYADLWPRVMGLILEHMPPQYIGVIAARLAANNGTQAEELVRHAEKRYPGNVEAAFRRRSRSTASSVIRSRTVTRPAGRRRPIPDSRWSIITPVGLAYAFGLFTVGAVLSQLLAKPMLTGWDWVALVPTLVVGVTALVLPFAGLLDVLNLLEDPMVAVWVVGSLVFAVTGFVTGFFIPSAAELGLIVRAWLAWNF